MLHSFGELDSRICLEDVSDWFSRYRLEVMVHLVVQLRLPLPREGSVLSIACVVRSLAFSCNRGKSALDTLRVYVLECYVL